VKHICRVIPYPMRDRQSDHSLHACKTTVGYDVCDTDREERVNFVKF
jgi:hypothetical protein